MFNPGIVTYHKKIAFFLCSVIALFGFPQLSNGNNLKRIILIETMSVPVVLKHSRWFIRHLNELGYQNGKNMDLTILKANGDREKAKHLLIEALKKGHPDLVVTNATMASQAAVSVLEGLNVPIVFFTVSDPVGAGLIKKIGVPTGKMITGKVNTISRETKVEMVIRMIREAYHKKPVKIGFIHSSYPSAIGDIRELKAIAGKRNDVDFLPYQFEYRKVPDGLPRMLEDVGKGIETLKNRVGFWWEPLGPLGEIDKYTRSLLDNKGMHLVPVHTIYCGPDLHRWDQG